MWVFKPFSGKEQAGLEGRVIDIGNTKIRVQNAIAEGGFSCVYLAHDAVNISAQYALKHMICPDGEYLELAMKEIQVMKLLQGHPNVVTLISHSILDMVRRKEVFLVMEFCEKSLINVLESRGAGYFEERQILLIFRDVCNAVFAMHSQSTPIAHRDLKAENVLLGSNGAWKLCDFGSTSTNHKCFERPDEMGIEEDNIRKYTTPAYRAPEMWDLFRREIICEKVDIWALGCLLYRLCYFKPAFDGESKLQILNGNYRIPELPKYSASVIGLIKDMLEGSPDARPDITQIWFRVNELLPVESQRHLPDSVEPISSINAHPPTSDVHNEGTLKRTPVVPKRSPPPPPSSREKRCSSSSQSEEEYHTRPSHGSPAVSGGGSPLGSFWSTQLAQDSQIMADKGSMFDEEKHNHINLGRKTSPSQTSTNKGVEDCLHEDFEIKFSPEKKSTFQSNSFDAFVADFDTNKLSKSRRELELEAQLERLKEQLEQANLEKAEVKSKYEKLSAICRSQRQEIQELKLHMASSTPQSMKDSSMSCATSQSETLTRGKIEGSVSTFQQAHTGAKPWQAFSDDSEIQLVRKTDNPKSVRTTVGNRNSKKQPASSRPSTDNWGFSYDSFSASPLSSSDQPRTPLTVDPSKHVAPPNVKKVESSQPAGWAGF
ncbi:CBL-interacting protein kinase 22 [Apostasia shenzhenica]|uniref:non-specific serine/threonine protein kinase n=1 Tax=Apostasia shenzhenica TaxID=1088818 RepID=A0A2I0B3Q6_9ASPA|nr:CBL-interacting protein kinase 22 [Apostasia shenzhenica]